MEETLQERHARLRQETENLRLQRECEEMQRIIEGRPPTDPLTTEDPLRTSSAGFKQPQLRMANPSSFKATDLKEYEEYEASWKTQLEAHQLEGARAIAVAATYLQGDARTAWVNEEHPPRTWDAYLTWCRNLVSDPQNRLSYALQEIKKLQQTKQSTREIWLKQESIRRDIPNMSHNERRAWDLIAALTPDIRDRVLTDHDSITSPEQVLLSAKKYEDRQKEKTQIKRDIDSLQSEGTNKRSRFAGRSDAPKFKRPVTSNNKGGGDGQKNYKFTGECFNCHQKGHKKEDCRLKPASGGSAPPPQGSKN